MNDTSPDRTEKDRAEQDRAEPDRTERGRDKRGRDKRGRAEENRTEKGRAEHDRTEMDLRDALEALADGVRAAPDAYRTARGEWLRRERRRRLVLAVLIAVVFTLATLIGLWVLNQTPSDPHVIFSGAPGTVATGGISAISG